MCICTCTYIHVHTYTHARGLFRCRGRDFIYNPVSTHCRRALVHSADKGVQLFTYSPTRRIRAAETGRGRDDTDGRDGERIGNARLLKEEERGGVWQLGQSTGLSHVGFVN